MAAVDFEHVTKVYADGNAAVTDANLQVADGELMVVVGPSGCGKSTLLRMLAGLEAVTSGTISIARRVVNELTPQQRNIAMVFQDYALYPHYTVRKNLEFPLRMRKTPATEREKRVLWAAELLGLSNKLDKLPKQLSGGERQRVAMGRALVREPTVFLLDEPLSNLDAKLRTEVRAEIAELQKKTGTTMFYVTHDQVEAMTLGHRITVLDKGRVQQTATPRELYERPANTFVAAFIGSPPMNLFPTTLRHGERGELEFSLGEQAVALPKALRDAETLRAFAGRPITVGIRPEAFSLAREGDGVSSFVATVEHVESLGHESLVAMRAGKSMAGTRFIVRLPAMTDLAAGAEARLAVDLGRARWFGDDGRAV
jgi:multiple sugar transport system ATP-binding protein